MHINEALLLAYQDAGATSSNLTEAEYQALVANGAADGKWHTFLRAAGWTGCLDEMMYAYLGDKGYAGTLGERLHQAAAALDLFRAAYSPIDEFSGGKKGWLFNGAADQSAFLQSAGGAVAGDGDPLGYISDLSGNGYSQIQTTGGSKMVCRVEIDGTRSVYAGTAKFTSASVSVPAERTEIYVFKQMRFSGSGEGLLMFVTDSGNLFDCISFENDWHKYITEASDNRGLYVASMDISRPAIFVRKKTAIDVKYAAYYLNDGSVIPGGGATHLVHSANTITTAYIGGEYSAIAHCCPFYMCIEGAPDLTDLLSYLVDTFGAWSPT